MDAINNPNSQLDPQDDSYREAVIASNETFCRDWYEIAELAELICPKD